ncbi:hypothetical protein GQ53DRAFT_399943 [Thozetella sp. PMI_491]|nr:hypothetical protein GQ53DRAFT_399943 [Thozetella sp. PMI_491]
MCRSSCLFYRIGREGEEKGAGMSASNGTRSCDNDDDCSFRCALEQERVSRRAHGTAGERRRPGGKVENRHLAAPPFPACSGVSACSRGLRPRMRLGGGCAARCSKTRCGMRNHSVLHLARQVDGITNSDSDSPRGTNDGGTDPTACQLLGDNTAKTRLLSGSDSQLGALMELLAACDGSLASSAKWGGSGGQGLSRGGAYPEAHWVSLLKRGLCRDVHR